MRILGDLLKDLPEGRIVEARVGTHWTGIVADVSGDLRCGLAVTLSEGHGQHGQPDVPQAGELTRFPGTELAKLSCSERPTLASIGMAAINALLPRMPHLWVEANAEQVLIERGSGRRVALIGHFPFVERVREQAAQLFVLEQNPLDGDLPAEAAPDIIPQADVVAITGMTLVNHTLEGLLEFCSPQAFVMLLGPSTPLSPVLFDFGVHLVSGAVVTDIEAVLRVLSEGGNFRQVHRAGIRLVNMYKP